MISMRGTARIRGGRPKNTSDVHHQRIQQQREFQQGISASWSRIALSISYKVLSVRPFWAPAPAQKPQPCPEPKCRRLSCRSRSAVRATLTILWRKLSAAPCRQNNASCSSGRLVAWQSWHRRRRRRDPSTADKWQNSVGEGGEDLKNFSEQQLYST